MPNTENTATEVVNENANDISNILERLAALEGIVNTALENGVVSPQQLHDELAAIADSASANGSFSDHDRDWIERVLKKYFWSEKPDASAG